jgi:hypothetical protein
VSAVAKPNHRASRHASCRVSRCRTEPNCRASCQARRRARRQTESSSELLGRMPSTPPNRTDK